MWEVVVRKKVGKMQFKSTIYICDYCGKQFIPDEEVITSRPPLVDMFSFKDVCDKCKAETRRRMREVNKIESR